MQKDEKPIQKVVFAVPTFSRAPCLEFQISAINTNAILPQAGITTVWRYAGGDPYVHKCRNRLASEFLTDHPDATDLFFLDDDLGWEAEAVLRVLRRPEDVIVGVYPKKNDLDEWPVELIFDADRGLPIVQDGLCLASLAPTGFMRIKRHVLERAAEESGRYTEEDAERGTIKCWDMFRTGFIPFDEGGKEGRWWGEDFFFCAMMRMLGCEIWVDPDMHFTHRGSKAWEGRFRNALETKMMQMGGGAKYTEDTPAIRRYGEASDLGGLVGMAFDRAMNGSSDLPEEILAMDGMSGRKYRMFINNAMQLIDNPRYLEIGSYKGSTALSACCGTTQEITCIDNWSYFGGPRQEFILNLDKWELYPQLLDKDFRTVDYASLGKHNVYVYDGSHREQAQYDGMMKPLAALDDEYLLIVDDWNWETARNGTMAGLRDSGQRIVSAIEIRTPESANIIHGQLSDWHNGYMIAVVRKGAAA